MTKQSIAVEFDLHQLTSYTDEFLATLWHLGQANPAPHGDYQAGEIASKVGFEIIRRWLKATPAGMYHHQQRDNYWSALTTIATYQPPEGVRVNAGQNADNSAWHRGTWVPKPETSRD